MEKDITIKKVADLKKGDYCEIRGEPCKVIEYNTSKPDKHGKIMARMITQDIFTSKINKDEYPTTSDIFVPKVTTKEYPVADQNMDELTLMEQDGNASIVRLGYQDGHLPQQIHRALQSDCEVFCTVISARGRQRVISVRTKS